MTRWTPGDVPSPLDLLEVERDDPSLDPGTSAELGAALRAAFAPEPLDPAVQRALVEAALADPVALPSPAESAAAAALGDALDARAGDDDDPHGGELALAVALRAAFAPDPPAPTAIERALATARPARPGASQKRPPRPLTFIGLGTAAGALALAAAVALALTAPGEAPRRPLPHVSRSTAALFETRFEVGRTSARIDRIASARGRELRDNRFARWGVP